MLKIDHFIHCKYVHRQVDRYFFTVILVTSKIYTFFMLQVPIESNIPNEKKHLVYKTLSHTRIYPLG